MRLLKLALLCLLLSAPASAQVAGPVIDVHRHAAWPGEDDATALAGTLAEMDTHRVVLGLLSLQDYDDLEHWVEAAPGRFLAGPDLLCPRNQTEPRYICFPSDEGWVDPDWVRLNVEAGKIRILHEVALNYYGISPSNPRLAPFWAMAAEHDLPVGIHTQRGPALNAPNSPRKTGCCPDFDPAMGNPELLRPILRQYPDLRIWLQHVGAGRGEYGPFWEDTLALLADYPNVHVDLSITNSVMPQEQYEDALRRLIDAGFGDRIMFGSDNMGLGLILERMEKIEWLTPTQRRAILYDNAARFLRLTPEEIARHHAM